MRVRSICIYIYTYLFIYIYIFIYYYISYDIKNCVGTTVKQRVLVQQSWAGQQVVRTDSLHHSGIEHWETVVEHHVKDTSQSMILGKQWNIWRLKILEKIPVFPGDFHHQKFPSNTWGYPMISPIFRTRVSDDFTKTVTCSSMFTRRTAWRMSWFCWSLAHWSQMRMGPIVLALSNGRTKWFPNYSSLKFDMSWSQLWLQLVSYPYQTPLLQDIMMDRMLWPGIFWVYHMALSKTRVHPRKALINRHGSHSNCHNLGINPYYFKIGRISSAFGQTHFHYSSAKSIYVSGYLSISAK